MEWKAHPISLRLLSPMHIGWRKSGNLQQTRPYVTGRVLWGALTEKLTRHNGKTNYQEVGEKVDEQLAFTYFFPSARSDSVELWPWGNEWDKFAWAYLGSHVSTALADGHSAEEGSLHETEFISPRTCDGSQVYLVGYIFAKRDYHEWQNVLSKLQFGGERGYGWGRIDQQQRGSDDSTEQENCFGMYKFIKGYDRPVLEALSSDAVTLAHTICGKDDAVGEIEPVVGRITGLEGFGHSFSVAEICLKPGKAVAAGARFSIEPKGLWKAI